MEPEEVSPGQLLIVELVKNIHDPVFTDWEQDFIQQLKGKKFSRLDKREQAIVRRLISWLRGS